MLGIPNIPIEEEEKTRKREAPDSIGMTVKIELFKEPDIIQANFVIGAEVVYPLSPRNAHSTLSGSIRKQQNLGPVYHAI